jgi:nitroreductase
MDVKDALNARRSIRGFKPTPLSRELITEILAAATRAPSTKNAQPWECIVLTGDLLREIGEANVLALRSGRTLKPEVEMAFPRGHFLARSQEVGKLLYGAMNIPREDKQQRQEWWEFGFRYFNAPVAIIMHFSPDIEREHALFDLGTVSQSICLMAVEKGLGTCITRQGVAYPEVIRERVKVPPENSLAISIAIGYANWSYPANSVITPRQPVDEAADWYGFD